MAEIDLFTLANHAEAVNGLLYLSGAGWDSITRVYPAGSQPQPQHFGIAISVIVPWTEANRPKGLTIWMEDEDGGRLMSAQGNLEMGRPPGMPAGSDLRAVLAISAEVRFPRSGSYRVLAELDGQRRSYSFRVLDQLVPSVGAA